MIHSSWYIECGRLKLVIMGNFLPFTPPPPPTHTHTHTHKKCGKSEFWKNEKKAIIIIIIIIIIIE